MSRARGWTLGVVLAAGAVVVAWAVWPAGDSASPRAAGPAQRETRSTPAHAGPGPGPATAGVLDAVRRAVHHEPAVRIAPRTRRPNEREAGYLSRMRVADALEDVARKAELDAAGRARLWSILNDAQLAHAKGASDCLRHPDPDGHSVRCLGALADTLTDEAQRRIVQEVGPHTMAVIGRPLLGGFVELDMAHVFERSDQAAGEP